MISLYKNTVNELAIPNLSILSQVGDVYELEFNATALRNYAIQIRTLSIPVLNVNVYNRWTSIKFTEAPIDNLPVGIINLLDIDTNYILTFKKFNGLIFVPVYTENGQVVN